MEKIHSFSECLDMAKAGKKHLMLGNGFSVALFPKIFNYKALADNIDSKKIKQLFSAIGTHDFEFVMRRLSEALDILKHYDLDDRISDQIKSDIEELKNTLINVISNAHPAKPSEITEAQYLSCRDFLSNFSQGKTYSFNYDLLLYWVLMHYHEDSRLKLPCDDGFRYLYQDESSKEENFNTSLHWQIGRENQQNIYYIHGAMHIFSDGSDIEKLSYTNIGIPLSEQVRNAIDEGKFPVFISEGSTEHKLSRIKKNGYLSRTFSSLKSIRGGLFIFGHSIRDEDDHIFDFLNQNNKNLTLYIGIYGPPSEPYNRVIIDKVRGWREQYKQKSFYIYDTSSVDVWNKV